MLRIFNWTPCQARSDGFAVLVEMAIEQNESVATEFIKCECEKIGVRIE